MEMARTIVQALFRLRELPPEDHDIARQLARGDKARLRELYAEATGMLAKARRRRERQSRRG